jgi:hypothetical protein
MADISLARSRMLLLSGSANRPLAEEIAAHVGNWNNCIAANDVSPPSPMPKASGTRARPVVSAVMRMGLSRRRPASSIASRRRGTS